MVKAAIKRPWIKGNAASPSHLQKLIVLQGWQGDSWSLITYCKNYKTALAANHYSGRKKPRILIVTSPIICPDRSRVPLISQSDRLLPRLIDTIIWSINSSCQNSTFLELIRLEKRAYTVIEIAKNVTCIILLNDKEISLLVHVSMKVASIGWYYMKNLWT